MEDTDSVQFAGAVLAVAKAHYPFAVGSSFDTSHGVSELSFRKRLHPQHVVAVLL